MKFFATPDQRVHFEEIPPVLADWIEKVPEAIDCWTQSDSAEARLFPLPVTGPGEESINEDWKAHVQPELHDWFRSARSIVSEDVRNMEAGEEHHSLGIPFAHVDAWLNALNQARLVLTEVHRLTDADLNGREIDGEKGEKALAIMQVGFFAWMQECLVAHLEMEGPDTGGEE